MGGQRHLKILEEGDKDVECRYSGKLNKQFQQDEERVFQTSAKW